jgi:hypothetical protein
MTSWKKFGKNLKKLKTKCYVWISVGDPYNSARRLPYFRLWILAEVVIIPPLDFSISCYNSAIVFGGCYNSATKKRDFPIIPPQKTRFSHNSATSGFDPQKKGLFGQIMIYDLEKKLS